MTITTVSLATALSTYGFVDPAIYGTLYNDGITDDSAPIIAAIAALQSAGHGGSIILRQNHAIASTLAITAANIKLVGLGSDINHNVGNEGAKSGTKLTWTGAAGGTMVSFASPITTSAQCLSGGGVEGIFFNSNGAGINIQLTSWRKGRFSDLFFLEPTAAGLKITTVATSLGEDSNSQQNIFENIGSRIFNSTGTAILLQAGSTFANTSFNTFINTSLVYNNGIGLECYDCDNNQFTQFRTNRAGGGTAFGVYMHGGNGTPPAGLQARGNLFMHYSSTVYCEGIENGMSLASESNRFENLDRGVGTNNVATPATGPSALMTWTALDGTSGSTGS